MDAALELAPDDIPRDQLTEILNRLSALEEKDQITAIGFKQLDEAIAKLIIEKQPPHE